MIYYCFLYDPTAFLIQFQMYRNNYNTQTGFSSSHSYQPQHRYTSTSGFGQRMPLYPIGPTLTQPQFKPIQRGISPSPYLSRQGMKPPSYENKYLQRAQNLSGQINLSYQERQRRLIEKNQRQIEEQEKRRQQIRASYERQIRTLSTKLNRNLQRKQKLHAQIETLQQSHEQLNQKLLQLRPPQRTQDGLQQIDRKQQQLIILKNRLMNSMRQNQIQLNKKLEEQQNYWQEQVTQKQKYLFKMQQSLRQKKLQLYIQKQKSENKPDLLSIEDQVRGDKYREFVERYEELEERLKYLGQMRQKTNKNIHNSIQLKKPQIHNANIRRQEVRRELVNLQIRINELQRVSSQMDAANSNLLKQLDRKQNMISKYEQDIHELKQKKQIVEADVNSMMESARARDVTSLSKSMSEVVMKINDRIREQQSKNGRLKNAYQKLYEILCSTASKNIHQTFTQALIS